jgi:hypothetical protein
VPTLPHRRDTAHDAPLQAHAKSAGKGGSVRVGPPSAARAASSAAAHLRSRRPKPVCGNISLTSAVAASATCLLALLLAAGAPPHAAACRTRRPARCAPCAPAVGTATQLSSLCTC